MGKDQQAPHALESAEASPSSFICCVCLDLLYKPIVLPCGHISCFWCVHRSMNGLRDSNCPICRQSYNHFPSICRMLEFLLLKMYPIEYKRREEQIQEEEKELGCFSAQFDYNASVEHCASTKRTAFISVTQNSDMSNPNEIPDEDGCTTKTAGVEGKNLLQDGPNRNWEWVSIADVQCVACKQLLFHPLVLNCGHVYCATCIMSASDKILRCEVCQSLHPMGFPKICLEFDQFLEQQFPKEYALRRDAAELKQGQFKIDCSTTYSSGLREQGSQVSSITEGDNLPWWENRNSKVHDGVGCDSCGIYPIIGDRYRCIDCIEKIGFDLCGDCYNTPSKLLGRFNQQHTPEHRFELFKESTFRNIMVRLVSGELATVSAVFNNSQASQISEHELLVPIVSSDDEDNTGSTSTAPVLHTEASEYENETGSPT